MMLIRTRVAPSGIHGLGLFAVDDLPVGTPVWGFAAGFDREITPAELAALPGVTRDHVRWFAFVSRDSGCWILSGDHACFMNHADDPNTGAGAGGDGPVVTVTRRAVAAGEELTCDYRAFDDEAAWKLGPAVTSPGAGAATLRRTRPHP